MLEINKIHCMEVRQGTRQLDDESIDCLITSPPYWGLRDYGLEPQIWDGDDNCEHEWGDELLTGEGYSSGGRKRWQHDQNREDNPDNWQKETSQGNFCIHCNAWRGSLGLEPTFELYIKHLCDIFDELKRVLKPTGTCWVNLGDSYAGSGGEHKPWHKSDSGFQHNGGYSQHALKEEFHKPKTTLSAKSLCQIPSRFAIEMTNRGWILRNELIWYKRNCLNGGTRLYAKTQKGTIPSTIKDLVRLKPETVKLWDGEKWNQVIEWIENNCPSDIKKITLRSGEAITCTGDHKFPLTNYYIKSKIAKELKVGDIIK